MVPKTEQQYRDALRRAIETGAEILDKGGSAIDAVEKSINLMEDDPMFNAGRGAVFTAGGKNELDAAIMDGYTLRAGAVAGVTRTRHPISLARAVMGSEHVMLGGAGADAFAKEKGLEQVDPSFFFTERRWQALVRQLSQDGRPIPPQPPGAPPPPTPSAGEMPPEPPGTHKFGTVGVAALDRRGNLAAGTSTGGIQAKRWGRVGDCPIIGAGTYASSHCAVSGTGQGEYFIRLTVASEICALVKYRNMPLQAATDQVIHQRLAALHGEGGVICHPSGWNDRVELQYLRYVPCPSFRRRQNPNLDLSGRTLK
jgi:L-asparaginase / beta-aspartyl-peptidase